MQCYIKGSYIFFDKLEFLKMYRSTSEKFYIALKTSASFWHLQLNLYPHYTLLRLGIMGYTVDSYGRRFFEKRYPPCYISNEAWKKRQNFIK